MPRRKIIVAIPLVILCAALVAVFWPEKEIPEPVYEGKKLSEWLDKLGVPQWIGNRETYVALKAIGTNGIPFYVEWIRYEPGVLWRAKALSAAKSRDWLHVKWYPQDPSAHRAFGAYQALQALGEKAKPAIPQPVSYTHLRAHETPEHLVCR